jgi:hypothetical protein
MNLKDMIVVFTDGDRREAERLTRHANQRENWHHGVLLISKDHSTEHLGCCTIYSILLGKDGKPGRHMALWMPLLPDTWPGRSLVEPIAKLYGFTGAAEDWNNDCQEATLDGKPVCVLTLFQIAKDLAP